MWFAGRVTLAKSVLEAIPTYSMLTCKLPRDSLKEIQKVQRAFIWGDTDESKKAHTVKWDQITKPIDKGGLGVKDLVEMNTACIHKLGWQVKCRTKSLRTRVLQDKYDRLENNFADIQVKVHDSNIWKSIASSWSSLNEMIYWRI